MRFPSLPPRNISVDRLFRFGPYALEVGWLVEPAYVNAANAVFVRTDATDAPVEHLDKSIQVEVIVGGAAARRTFDIQSFAHEAGHDQATLITTAVADDASTGKVTFAVMSEGAPEERYAAMPRWIAGLVIAVIALASVAALVRPSLPFTAALTGPTEVGAIRAQVDEPEAAGRIGSLAPNFEWNAPGGKVMRLSGLRGKVVVVNFWATWCLPCRQEMPALNRVAESSPDIVFLEIDLQESGDQVRSFFDQLGLDRLMPLLDTDDLTTRRYGVLSLPSTFFVDRGGTIRHLEIGGPLTEGRIRDGIAKAS